MAGNVGRNTIINRAGTRLIGVRSFTLDWAGEAIDITSGEDNGFRTLLSEAGQRQIDLNLEGMTKDNTLKNIIMSGASTLLTDITIQFAIIDPTNTTAATLSGDFYIGSYNYTGPYNEGITFSCPMQSSGEWTYTPEAA